MTRIKKLALATLTALALLAGALAASPTANLAGDPSQWDTSAKVNEYEGQHRIAMNFTKIEY